jgi:import inner membrane translocase subunit TIM21
MLRTLSSDASQKGGNEKKKSEGEDTTSEIVLTPGQKVVEASRLTMWGGIAVFAACCAYYIGRELFPTKMSPNRVFDRSFAAIRADSEVQRRYGDSLKAYGRDHGGHREGRRNFIEHTEYTDAEDGSKRTRVRYNLEGRFGTAFVFAEVSASMPSGEFVYILVQDKSNGRVHTVVDNRAALTAARLASGSKEAQSAMSQLLGGGGQK